MRLCSLIIRLLPVILLIFSCSRFEKTQNDHQPGWAADTASINKSLGSISYYERDSLEGDLRKVLNAKALSEKINYSEGTAKAIFEWGNVLYRQNNYDEALKRYSEALSSAQKFKMDRLHGNCLERMASLHLTDDPGLALKLYYEALGIFEKVNDNQGIAKVYNILGSYKTSKQEYDAAEAYFRKAININLKAGNAHYLIENKGNLANLYEAKGEFAKAEEINQELVKQLVELHDSMNLTVIYFNLASIHQRQSQLQAAISYLQKAIKIAEPVYDTNLLSTLYGNYGELCLATGDKKCAAKYLNLALICARAVNDPETELEIYRFLIRLDSLSGRFHEAYLKTRRSMVLQDTISAHAQANNVKNAELKYENEKKKNLIELQELKINTAKHDRMLWITLFLTSLLAIIMLGYALYILSRSVRKNKLLHENQLMIKHLEVEKMQKDQEIRQLELARAEEALQSKDRELVCIAMGLQQRTELLNSITSKIEESLTIEKPSDPLSAVQQIITSIRLQLNGSNETELFNQQFAQVHQKFHANLKTAHPGLTKSEIRFCAYLKLNLSSSHIANSLNVTPDAIRKIRYRIRKKMNLAPEDSLEDYISGF